MDLQNENVFDYPHDPLLTDELHQLHQYIEPYLHGSILDNSSELMELLAGGEFRTLIRQVASAICEDPAALLLCAQRSQSHPLGFSKILILSTEWYQIRLNFWPVLVAGREREDVHDHRFDFASTILAGTLIAELYEIVDVGDPMVHFVDRLPLGHREPYVLEEVGVVHARKVGVHRLAEGSAYVARSESLHRIIATEDAPVVTAFVKFVPTRPDANVLVAPAAAFEREFQVRQFFTPDTVCSTIRKILEIFPE